MLNVNAVADSKTYGATDPSFGHTLSGFVNGDTAGTVTVGRLGSVLAHLG